MDPITITIFAVCLPYLTLWFDDLNCEPPYYDESEIWSIDYYDKVDVDFECYGANFPKVEVGACSRLWPNSDGEYKIIMGTNRIFQYQNLSTLEHEILHLMCKCNWHKGGL